MPASSNLERFDLSNWLIHFTRPIDTHSNSCPRELPAHWGFEQWIEDTRLSPFFLLRHLLRKRQIYSTWSLRKGRPTIYGPHPVVCFTEMPLAAFLKASRERAKNNENASPYAVVLPKAQAFAAGARPVIYGLSRKAKDKRHGDGTRRFPESILPEREQYRFVTFSPGKQGWLDWTHEREWRWPNRQASGFTGNDEFIAPSNLDTHKSELLRKWREERQKDRSPLDGLCLDNGKFSGIGFIVRTSRQSRLLRHDILRLVDTGRIKSNLFSFVIEADKQDYRALVEPREAEAAVDRNAIRLEPYYSMSRTDRLRLAKKFMESLKKLTSRARPSGRPDGIGKCWLWLQDNMHDLTRALLGEGLVTISNGGRYLIEIEHLFPKDLTILDREDLADRVAQRVMEEFAVPAVRFSVMKSRDPDGIPYYVSGAGDEEIHSNYAHREEDFV